MLGNWRNPRISKGSDEWLNLFVHFRSDSATILQFDLESGAPRLLLSFFPSPCKGYREVSCVLAGAHTGRVESWKIILHTLGFSKGPTKVGGTDQKQRLWCSVCKLSASWCVRNPIICPSSRGHPSFVCLNQTTKPERWAGRAS